MDNIFPTSGGLNKSDKEQLTGHRGIVLWMCGLSGSGKSTIAKELERRLHEAKISTKRLDGDNLRSGINSNLSFTQEDRVENNRRAAEIAKLFADNGTVVIASFISPTKDIRVKAKDIIGEDNFKELYIKASFEECARRDVKGLYKRALAGEIKNFTGLDAPFVEPENPFMVVDTENTDMDESVQDLVEKILEEIKL